jgi:hypothetical protein
MIGPAITAPRDALTFIADSKVPAISGGPKAVSKLLPIVVKAFPRAKMIKDRIARDDISETLRSRVPAVSNAALTRTRKRSVRALDSPNFPIIVLLRSGMMTKRRIRVMEGRMAKTEFAYGDIRYEPRIRTSADRFGGAVCNS